MPERKKIEETILRIVSEQYNSLTGNAEARIITLYTDIRKDLGFDSIMLVVLQIGIEDAFHIRFDPVKNDLKDVFTTIQNISDCVQGIIRDEEV
ncbi:MAG: hypothetical protein HFH12_07910 [Dorea sp.]|nr:hypothetical protein [Dorea sp.]